MTPKRITYQAAYNWVLAYHEFKPTFAVILQQVSESLEGEHSDSQLLKHWYGKRGYCKYCYKRHIHWYLSNDHWPPCWICVNCGSATTDENMRGN